jgi:hypothetical protein
MVSIYIISISRKKLLGVKYVTGLEFYSLISNLTYLPVFDLDVTWKRLNESRKFISYCFTNHEKIMDYFI